MQACGQPYTSVASSLNGEPLKPIESIKPMKKHIANLAMMCFYSGQTKIMFVCIVIVTITTIIIIVIRRGIPFSFPQCTLRPSYALLFPRGARLELSSIQGFHFDLHNFHNVAHFAHKFGIFLNFAHLHNFAMLLLNLIQVTESISGSVVHLAMFILATQGTLRGLASK